jgi:putative addiction module component (TIGR02574 family)
MSFQEVKNMALELPAKERAELADFLLETLEHPSQEEIDRRWAEVITRRVEELRSGKVTGVPGDVVLQKLRTIVESDLPS